MKLQCNNAFITLLLLGMIVFCSSEAISQSTEKPTETKTKTINVQELLRLKRIVPFDVNTAEILSDPIILRTPKNLIARIRSGEIPLPKSLSELPYLDTETNVLSTDEAKAFGIPFVGSTSSTNSRKIFVKNFIKYKEFVEDGQTVQVGVGIRWIVNVRTSDTTASLSNSISFLAASAEIKSIEASARFQVLGLNNPEIDKLAQVDPALNVDNYVKMYSAFQKVQDLMNDTHTTVLPVPLAVSIEYKPDSEYQYTDVLVKGWAIARIAERKTWQEAQNSYPDATSSDKDIIERVYREVGKVDQPNKKPDEEAQAKAKKLLRYKIKISK